MSYRVRLLQGGARVALAGLVAAELAATLALRGRTTSGLLVIAGLLFPVTASFGALVLAVRPWGTHLRNVCHLWDPATVLVFLAAALGIGGVQLWLANHWLVDAPLGPTAVAADGIAIAASLVLALSIAVLFRRLRGDRHAPDDVRWADAGAGILLAAGGLSGVYGAVGLSPEHAAVQSSLALTSALAFSGGSVLWLVDDRRVRHATLAGAAVLLAFAGAFILGPPRDQVYAAIARSQGTAPWILSTARRLVDRDGDGFSPILGGGDCDDGDALVHPLSIQGRDCLDWIDSRAARQEEETTVHARAEGAPTLILLLTIDAFRCGFGVGDREELRNICPALRRLAREGRASLDAHTEYPVTTRAMTILQTGDRDADPAIAIDRPFYLATELRALGYSSGVIVTHPNIVADLGVRRSFDEVDDSLVEEASLPAGVTSHEVTSHLLGRISTSRSRHEGGLFLWAHYLDPHAPYVQGPGARAEFSDVDAYAAEVLRTDREIARLTDALRSRPDADRILVVVTADHGEEFGEHGNANHGLGLHEETARVPIIVWTAGADHRDFGASSLPHSLGEIAPFLMSVVSGSRFVADDATFVRTSRTPDAQVAVISDAWKLIYHRTLNYTELYDLRADPEERKDLSVVEPERVRRLGRLVGGYFRELRVRRAADLLAQSRVSASFAGSAGGQAVIGN